MLALTMYQPSASLIAAGVKMLETRSWRTEHRGRLAIHAAAKPGGLKVLRSWYQEAYDGEGWTAVVEALDRAGQIPLPFRSIVCTVDVVSCVAISYLYHPPEDQQLFGDFRTGQYVWYFENVRLVSPPAPVGGKYGLWEWSNGQEMDPGSHQASGSTPSATRYPPGRAHSAGEA